MKAHTMDRCWVLYGENGVNAVRRAAKDANFATGLAWTEIKMQSPVAEEKETCRFYPAQSVECSMNSVRNTSYFRHATPSLVQNGVNGQSGNHAAWHVDGVKPYPEDHVWTVRRETEDASADQYEPDIAEKVRPIRALCLHIFKWRWKDQREAI